MKKNLNNSTFKIGEDFTETVNDVPFKMIYVKGGTFIMGATKEPVDKALVWKGPAHEVTLTKDFYIGECMVTQALWEAVMGTTIEQQQNGKENTQRFFPGVGADYPMYYVSWNEAQEFCIKLCGLLHKTYVLPTEAQWEFAARGGNKHMEYKYSGSDNVDEVAWYDGNSDKSTHPVGTKKPNELGIYDMSGNVAEWCGDRWGKYSGEAQIDPTGPKTGSIRILRGGDWFHDAGACRVSNRGCGNPEEGGSHIGFRVVMIP